MFCNHWRYSGMNNAQYYRGQATAHGDSGKEHLSRPLWPL